MKADTLENLAEMPRRLRTAAAELAGKERFRPSADPLAFSVVEHACHLRDLEEEGYTLRIRRILREDDPELADFDGAVVAAGRDYLTQDLATALRDFESARKSNIETLSALPASALDRTGQLAGKGTVTLHHLAQLMLEHDAGHSAELRDLLLAAGRGRSA
jgi:hypothetical protein